MKNFMKDFRIPKTILGLALLGLGVWLKNETLIHAGLAILGVGLASKGIKVAQGGSAWQHEKQFLAIGVALSDLANTLNKKKGN